MNGPILSYVTAHRWYVATIAVLFVAWLVVEVRERLKRPRPLNDKKLYVDESPWKDPRDVQRVDQEHRKLYPSRFS